MKNMLKEVEGAIQLAAGISDPSEKLDRVIAIIRDVDEAVLLVQLVGDKEIFDRLASIQTKLVEIAEKLHKLKQE